MFLSYITTESDGALTLDQLLRGPLSLSAREAREAKRLGLTVDGAPFFANQRVGAGRTLRIPLAEYDRPGDFSASGDVAVLYEDDALLAVRKPAPLQVHPSPSAPRGADTLEGRVQRYLHSGAHPVHRLDAETTGIVLFAKLPYAQAHIQRQMQTDAFRKEYLAWVCGVPAAPEGVIDAPIARLGTGAKRAVRPDGRRAVTHYRVEQAAGGRALIRLRLETGRTHQIRVHLAHIGCPICGDYLYGRELPELKDRFALHSARLRCVQPVTGKTVEVVEPLPEELKALLTPSVCLLT